MGMGMADGKGHRRLTQQDIADLADVSRATVSAVINNTRYVSPELRARILDAIDHLGYVPNIVARSMKTNRTMTIGLMLPNILSPIWATIARGVEDVARQSGFSTILYDTDEQSERMEDGLRKLREKRADGIVLAPCASCTNFLGQYISRTGTAFVLVDRYLEDVELDTVLCDGEEGTYQAVRHLLDTGRRRIGIITLSLGISTGRDRLDGYRRALSDAGVGIHDDWIALGGRGERDGYDGAMKLLTSSEMPLPDALFISSHLMTVGALKALRERGLRVPQDVAVIGFDELPWMSLMAPPLTVVSQPAYEMGAKAAGVLLSRLIGDQTEPAQRIVLPTELVHRASCCEGGDEDRRGEAISTVEPETACRTER